MSVPRGVRNNNPGNIRKTGHDRWVGMSPPADQTDPDFLRFLTPELGIRAIGVLLRNYAVIHKLTTIRGIINRWAPPGENDTAAYIDHVAKVVNRGPDEPLPLLHIPILAPVVEVIIAHENAGWKYPSEVLLEGLRLAEVLRG